MRRLLTSRLAIGSGLTLTALIPLGIFMGARAAPKVETPPPAQTSPEDNGDAVDNVVRVMTIRPRHDTSFEVSIQQLASVRAYFQADLKARVAGVIRSVKKDLGDQVKKGELLIQIDVPDLEKEVAHKEAIVEQRLQELRLVQAHVKNAHALVEVAQTNVAQRRTEVIQAKATVDFRYKRLTRFKELAKREAINADVVDEQEREFQAGEAAAESAQVAVQKSLADVKEKQASLEGAQVDVDLKRALVEVARKELERVRALADFSRITAPFDGVITRRNVDPGDFVQNSTSGNTEILLTISRTDIVTVEAKVPDNAATFVNKNTPVTIQVDQLPGVLIQGKISRFSPSIENIDRTMRVEVDLLNAVGVGNKDLRSGTEITPARATGLNLATQRLLPGMNGYMRLQLNKFANVYLLPSSAIFSRGGKPYILEVRDGITRLLPVQVQVNDGTHAKVAVIVRPNEAHAGEEVLQELTGVEEIVASRQAEIGEGQAVQTTLQSWK